MSRYNIHRLLPLVMLIIQLASTIAFSPSHIVQRIAKPSVQPLQTNVGPHSSFSGRRTRIASEQYQAVTKRMPNVMRMSDESDEGPGILTAGVIVAILLVFVGSSIAPLLNTATGPGAVSDLNLGDSVVTRQDAPGKLKNYQSTYDRLSRAKIQEKLNYVPVFYLVDSATKEMKGNIYLSFDDATGTAAVADSGLTVKSTTLDQVMYPLILKRGRMKMSPPPEEVQRAEESLLSESASKSYKLVPSAAALKDAEETKLQLVDGDVPLFVANRLAFASRDGPQVPLFLEKADCVTSYSRLRESGGNRLPAEPNIRTTTLMDVLESMEKGTRPAVSQLQFYATAGDLMHASEIM